MKGTWLRFFPFLIGAAIGSIVGMLLGSIFGFLDPRPQADDDHEHDDHWHPVVH